jgi:cell division protein FtsB
MEGISRKLGVILGAPLLAIALAYFSFAYWQQLTKAQTLRVELAQTRANIARKEQEVEGLRRRLALYQSPRYLDYVEFVAREAFGMARPGDTVIVVIPKGKAPR